MNKKELQQEYDRLVFENDVLRQKGQTVVSGCTFKCEGDRPDFELLAGAAKENAIAIQKIADSLMSSPSIGLNIKQ